IFETSFAMQEAIRSHPELIIMGEPSFLFSFRSDEFDVYHVNDHMRPKGWRFNGQQYPNALHMAVTRPQTQAGVVEAFAQDLAEAVAYAKTKGHEPAASGAIYGGVAGGMNDEADEFIKMVMASMLDEQQALPPGY
ncbi:MAG: aspartate aminotransferase family protein, partial [Acidimicrobiales bacterium]|nr:aspartate aminotransferase family protein [Acidimicrobiales bacterium]